MSEEHPVLGLERAAMARWCNGDPGGFLEISAPDVVYFDPMLARRLDGHAALTAYYKPIWGQIYAERYEFIDPRVIAAGDCAVLAYNFNSWGGSEDALRWHCTEVYRRDAQGWKIVSTHWSYAAKP